MKIYIQMSNAGRIAGIWSKHPTDLERANAYSKYLEKEVDGIATIQSTWIEIYELDENGLWEEIN